jgi:4-hydroxy-2,2'-bipyrrole-5-methanol synthase
MDVGLSDFYQCRSPDLFAKCNGFRGFRDQLAAQGLYRTAFRLELLSPLDRRVIARDPRGGCAKELICLDSNSYLGLHLHPRVIGAVHQTLDEAGYGTPSAQLLAGTNKWLIALEERVASFHRREAALIFPSGYATNIGLLTGILRSRDLFALDRLSHASIHDGCRWSGARGGAYDHNDIASLDRVFGGYGNARGGRLIATDGVFSMHGRLAPLPGLVDAAKRNGARLMVDEAHSVGVIGATGRGIEEHFGLEGSVDILMGTFSKAPGSVGGYVCGSEELIEYLRFFARSNMFTAALPAPLCAGTAEAFRIMEEEPEHRERLWENARRLHRQLSQAGFRMAALESPILTVPAGNQHVLLHTARDLFEAGIKCGSVGHPAVPRDECLLRLSVNARHTAEDIDLTVEALARIGRARGFLGLPQTGAPPLRRPPVAALPTCAGAAA